MKKNYLDSIAEQLLNFLRTRFENLEIRDADGKPTSETPAQARFFVFDFGKPGNRVLVAIDDVTLRVIYGSNIGKNPDEAFRKKWFDFLRSLRIFVSRTSPPQLLFKPQDISRGRFSVKKEMQQLVSGAADRTNVAESAKFGALRGRSRSSQQKLGPVRIIIKHSTPVDEAVRGSRTRRIERIYVENALGERRMMPVNNLAGARAMARHLAEGGSYDDDIGRAIVEMIAEMSDLRRFVREMRDRQFEDATTQEMVEASKCRYQEVKEVLARMKGSRGYGRFKESFEPGEQILSEVDTAELRERFTRKIFPEALETVLPRVQRAYQMRKRNMKESISPDRAHRLARENGRREFLESFVYADGRSLVARVLEDIAEALDDPKDPLSEFAARWADKLRRLEEQVDETLQEEYGLAVQLARGYIKGLRESQPTSSHDLKNAETPSVVSEADEFSDWANDLDSADDFEANDEEISQLQELMSSPIPAGDDGINAVMMMQSMGIDDDDLRDRLQVFSDNEGMDADARPEIEDWLQENRPDLWNQIRDSEVQEAVGGDPVEDFIDSVTDDDIRKYGDDTADEPVELYRRMDGLI